MRSLVTIISISIGLLVLSSCAKYKDPPKQTDPSTSHYCNDPTAVNYNVGFPGIPDNTVCIYLVNLFTGNFVFTDSITQVSTGYYLYYRVDTLHIYALNDSQLAVTGFCSNLLDTVKFKAYVSSAYTATVDTIVGDSVTNVGQILCRPLDTVNGSMLKYFSDTTNNLHIQLNVFSDTGATLHIGTAVKL